MSITHSSIWTYETESRNPWTLYLFDDVCDDAFREFSPLYDRQSASFSESAIRELVRKFLDVEDGSNMLAVALLPVWASQLDGLGRLVIADFPVSGDPLKDVESLCELSINRHNTAFLVDRSDSRPEVKEPDFDVLSALQTLRVPRSRVAFYTFGKRGAIVPGIREILKTDLVKNSGEALTDWWELIRGRISTGRFNDKTSRIEEWRHPSKILSELNQRDFRNFVERLAAESSVLGVWEWVASELFSEDSGMHDIHRQYAYLCGKAVFYATDQCGGGVVPFTAIRGLLYGLCLFGLPNSLAQHGPVELMEEPLGPPPIELIDNVGCFLWYDSGAATFEALARTLVEFVKCVDIATQGDVGISKVTLKRNPEECRITISFDGDIPQETGDDLMGSVTRTWDELCGCFGSENPPTKIDHPGEIQLYLVKTEPSGGRGPDA